MMLYSKQKCTMLNCNIQGSYRPWKVLEFYCSEFQAWKVLDKGIDPGNPWNVLEF